MSKLVLDSLEIKNFRAFKHLRIEKLGRVNLFVGKNNVGKTSVLEALWIYGRRGEPAVLWDILRSHDEQSTPAGQKYTNAEEQVDAIRYLFNGRQDVKAQTVALSVGPLDVPEQALSVSLEWVSIVPSVPGQLTVERMEYDKALTFGRLNPSIIVKYGPSVLVMHSLVVENYHVRASVSGEKPCVFASANGMTKTQISQLWDSVALTDSEADVLGALHIVAPEVERVNLIADKGSSTHRNPTVKARGSGIPIPLRSMGEGMSRMFGIALALVNAKDGMLLIDEVDTGLHYSVLPDLWKLIFEVAHRLNVQVFATTHSKDCLEAFQYAADENTEEEGVLIRLENRKAGVGAVTFDEKELAIVTRERIEVR